MITAASYDGIIHLNPNPAPVALPFYKGQCLKWLELTNDYIERGNKASAKGCFEVAAAYRRLYMQALRGQ
ncbi:hypothetical protein JGK44_000712 [Shewanella algae]|nr:hypothetical protein [Shewanella algae]